MRGQYLVCTSCNQGWIWRGRLVARPHLARFTQQGAQWPKKSYQQALVEPAPGLAGGGETAKKQKKKTKGPEALHQALRDHWKELPVALQQRAQLLGLAPPAPDLPTLLQEHLQSLPPEVKQAVEKVIEPAKPEPTVANKLKSSVGLLKQLSTRKSALQAKADVVKQQYGALRGELKDLKTKIEDAQKELQQHTETYNLQLETVKQLAENEIEEGELTEEKLNGIFHSIGLTPNEDQLKAFTKQLAESASKRRKCG